MSDNRHPAGTSVGGQWAPGGAAEVDDVDSTEIEDPENQPEAAAASQRDSADEALDASRSAKTSDEVYTAYVSTCREKDLEPRRDVLDGLASSKDAPEARNVLREHSAAAEAFDEKSQRKAERAVTRTGRLPTRRLERRHNKARAQRGLPSSSMKSALNNYGASVNGEVGARALETLFARLRSGRF